MVLDLCVRTFVNVVPFVMEFVPGLSAIEERIAYAKRRWGLEVRRYPHWVMLRCLRDGVFCDGHWTDDKGIPEMKLAHVYALVRADTGIAQIATGYKRSDSRWRRQQMAKKGVMKDIVAPLAGWQKIDVLAYLASKKIPLPPSEGSNANGIDLSTPSVLWLHDNFPADFAKLCKLFPYAEAIVKRREFHGVE